VEPIGGDRALVRDRVSIGLLPSGSCRPPAITLVLVLENDESSSRRRYLARGDKAAIADRSRGDATSTRGVSSARRRAGR